MPGEARDESDSLPPAYRDPKGFLREERFHRSTQFTPSYFALEDASTVAAGAREQHTVTYAVAGSTDPAAPTLVWINGMGAHRLAAMLMDGLFAAHGVRLLTLDRPSAGKSTPCPLAHRQSTSLDSLVAVLAQEGLTSFSILSHSNGLLYTLYTLLHLPPHLHVRSWTLSSPYVPPWLSGSALLSAARWVPPLLTSRLGAIAGAAQRVLDPLSRSAGWSAGVVKDLSSGAAAWSSSSGFVSLGTAATSASPPAAAAPPADEADPEQLPPPKQLARFRRVNAQRAPHRRLFGGEYVPPGLFNAGMKVALDEGLDAMGLEAMMCLRQGEGARWGWGEDGDDRDESKLFERGFAALKRKWDAGGGEARVEMSVWVPDDDGLVPKQGHEYLRALLVDQLTLVEPGEWHVVEDAGHDDTLARTCVMEPLLDKVVRVHREEVAAAQ